MYSGENDFVVLVNEKNQPLGKLLKSKVHHSNTPLHRGFSVFLFNKRGELLLQQRSRFKKTWPLVWSNSCCGHPMPGERISLAARRRLNFELGIKKVKLFNVLPKYRYKFEKDGIVENEICPVLVGFINRSTIIPNNLEVEAIKWCRWEDFLNEIKSSLSKYSPWCIEEAKLLAKNKYFLALYKKHCSERIGKSEK